jgi:hypothetical protein
MKKIKNKRELRDLILEGKDISEYDYSSVTDMSNMFRYCSSLEIIPFMDTSLVRNMYGMFKDCINLKSIPFLDTSSLFTDMYAIFYNCKSLRKIGNIEQYLEEEILRTNSPFLREKYPEYFI